MTKRPGDQTSEPEGGRAAERLRQFREARQPTPAPEEDTEQEGTERGGQGAAPDEASDHGADEPVIRKDNDG